MEDWSIIAVSKSGAPVPGAQASISADLLNRQSALERLGDAKGATHLFYAAYAPRASVVEEAEPNLALFINGIEGVEAAGAKLEHVVLITGAKYYGVHLGPSAAPARETNPRHIGPNFYYAQEDYLRSRSPAAWSWTHLVPTHLTGFSTGNPMNLVLTIAVYGRYCTENFKSEVLGFITRIMQFSWRNGREIRATGPHAIQATPMAAPVC